MGRELVSCESGKDSIQVDYTFITFVLDNQGKTKNANQHYSFPDVQKTIERYFYQYSDYDIRVKISFETWLNKNEVSVSPCTVIEQQVFSISQLKEEIFPLFRDFLNMFQGIKPKKVNSEVVRINDAVCMKNGYKEVHKEQLTDKNFYPSRLYSCSVERREGNTKEYYFLNEEDYNEFYAGMLRNHVIYCDVKPETEGNELEDFQTEDEAYSSNPVVYMVGYQIELVKSEDRYSFKVIDRD